MQGGDENSGKTRGDGKLEMYAENGYDIVID